MSRCARGFSLLELMVVMTVVAIMVGLAVPSYRTWMANTRVRNAAESIQNGLRTARNEAAQRGVNVRFELPATTSQWTVCVVPKGQTDCAGTTPLDQHDVSDSTGIVVTGSTATANLTDFDTLTDGLPGGITFGPLARPLTTDYGKTALLRIDTASTAPDTRRLATTVSAGGSIQMCDALLKSSVAANGCLPP